MTTPAPPRTKSGTVPPPAKKLPSRPPVAPGRGPSRAGTPPPNTVRARQAARGPAGPQGRPGPSGRQGGSQRRAPQRVISGVRQAGGKQSAPTSYQGAILAEFVAAVLLVAATPFAKKDQPGISPYVATDVMQLVAITVVYLVLALLSGVNRGAARFSAWFGLLLLLGIGLGEAARLAKLLDVFGLQARKDAQPQTGGQ